MTDNQWRRYVTAYLLDRADQYKTESGSWIGLCDAAKEVASGEFEKRVAEGELDDAELAARVKPMLARRQ